MFTRNGAPFWKKERAVSVPAINSCRTDTLIPVWTGWAGNSATVRFSFPIPSGISPAIRDAPAKPVQ
jgi:hypothetical protein